MNVEDIKLMLTGLAVISVIIGSGLFAVSVLRPPAPEDVSGPDYTVSPDDGVTCYVYETNPEISGCVRNDSTSEYDGNISNITVEMEVPA